MPKVMPAMVITESHCIKGVALISTLVVMINSSAGASRKRKLIQNLLQSSVRSFIGDDLRIQNDFPSMLTPGKVNRPAIAAITKAASPRFRKEMTFCR